MNKQGKEKENMKSDGLFERAVQCLSSLFFLYDIEVNEDKLLFLAFCAWSRVHNSPLKKDDKQSHLRDIVHCFLSFSISFQFAFFFSSNYYFLLVSSLSIFYIFFSFAYAWLKAASRSIVVLAGEREVEETHLLDDIFFFFFPFLPSHCSFCWIFFLMDELFFWNERFKKKSKWNDKTRWWKEHFWY